MHLDHVLEMYDMLKKHRDEFWTLGTILGAQFIIAKQKQEWRTLLDKMEKEGI